MCTEIVCLHYTYSYFDIEENTIAAKIWTTGRIMGPTILFDWLQLSVLQMQVFMSESPWKPQPFEAVNVPRTPAMQYEAKLPFPVDGMSLPINFIVLQPLSIMFSLFICVELKHPDLVPWFVVWVQHLSSVSLHLYPGSILQSGLSHVAPW